MKSALHWNDPTQTWKLASYQPASERRAKRPDRRTDDLRAALGDRRVTPQRTLPSLRRL